MSTVPTSATPRWILPLVLMVSTVTVGLVTLWPADSGIVSEVREPAIPVPGLGPRPSPPGMVWIPAGKFTMGTDFFPLPDIPNPQRIKPDESPAHEVELDGYWIDTTEVTNRDFEKFVAATGYQTFSEKIPTRADLAQSGMDASLVKDEFLVPGSLCFNPDFDFSTLDTSCDGWEMQVWRFVPGANWKHPDGPETSIEDRMDHPVVHVNWADAVAYCEWAGKRLPTEAEFEYASRNAGKATRYPWGNELTPGGDYVCNYYQGEFPAALRDLDGYPRTSPVKSFAPSPLGLFDISGNVWEWCHDYYDAQYYQSAPRQNPQGPEVSHDPLEPGIVKRVIRGGSFMCNTNNCTGYRCGARMRGEAISGTFHTGFRCALGEKDYDRWKARQAE